MTDRPIVFNELTPRFRDSFEQLSSEIRAVPPDKYHTLNLELEATVVTVLGAWPQIRELKSELAKLPEFNFANAERLEAYALALGHAQTLYRTAAEPPPSPAPLAEAVIHARGILLCEANTLIRRGLITPKATDELKGGTGYKNVAFDLFALCNLMKKRWSSISSRTTLTRQELDRAENLADQLLTAVGVRERAPEIPAQVIQDRLAAFTLLVNAYDEVRSAVLFLRKQHGDGDSIAPSLYLRRRRGKQKSKEREGSAADVSPASAVATPTRVDSPANILSQEAPNPTATGPFVSE